MTETESIIKRLTESDKLLVASASKESWRINRVFPEVKEVFPEAKIYNCIGLIFLIARKEHKESLKKYLEKKHTELTQYSEWQRSKNWENGDKEEVERNIKEIEETLKELERE